MLATSDLAVLDRAYAAAPDPKHRIVRMRQVADKLGLSASHIYALIGRGRFPRPFTVIPGGQARGWLESDVNAWIARRSETP